MKKLLVVGTISLALTGCQLVEEISTSVTSAYSEIISPAEQQQFEKMDAQFERLKTNAESIAFNGEAYIKSTRAVKADNPYFISLALSEDRSLRKSILSQTIYLSDPEQEPETTAAFLKSGQAVCNLKLLNTGTQDYYACNENSRRRFIVLVDQQKNIISYRSFTSYQQIPTQAEEFAIVDALKSYPLDAIGH